MDSRRPLSDRHLIAEQPGMTILLTGLLLAFFLGYTAKSLLSPNRIAARIEKAASHIHKDVKVTFSEAKVSLSSGIIPRFAVIISDVRMESSQDCLGAPVMIVDELSLPISFLNLIQGKAPVRRIEANDVHLILREDPKSCAEAADSLVPIANATPPQKTQAVTLTPSEAAVKYRNDVRRVFARSLKISSERHPQYATELQNFAVKVMSFEPKVIEVTAKTQLFRDTQVGDYLSHANLYLQYKESPEAQVQTHFFGNWREGHYSVIASYSLEDRILAVESDLKHIPLSQILALLQKYDLASKNLNGRQVWVSTKARLMGPLDEIRSTPLEVRDVKVEGDLGELYVERINVSSLEPLHYEPIQIEVRKLDVEKLMFLLNRPRKSGILAGLGVFAGRAEVMSDRRIKLTGEHSGLEFIFSNKGQRELQVIDSLVGDASLEGDNWSFQIKRVVPRGGVFAGDLKVVADRDFESIEAKINVDELVVAEPVQKLMTGGGTIGPMMVDSDLHLRDGKVRRLRGQLRIESMEVEGVTFGKTRSHLDWNGAVVLNTQIQSLKVAQASRVAPVLKDVTLASWWTPQGLSLNSLSGRLESRDFRHFSWKGFQGMSGRSGRLLTDGSWDESAQLRGSVTVRDARLQRRWKIEGTRELPVFVEEKNFIRTRK